MIHNATKLIEAKFRSEGLKVQIEDAGEISAVLCGLGGKNCALRVNWLSLGEENDAKMLSAPIARFPEEKRDAGYRLANDLNVRYRFVRWVIDPDGDLHVEYDLPTGTPSVVLGEAAFEITVRALKIVDETYPSIMRTLWAE